MHSKASCADCPTDEERRAKALAIQSEFLHESSLLCEGELAASARAAQRRLQPKTVGMRRGSLAPLDVFDKLAAKVAPMVEHLLQT